MLLRLQKSSDVVFSFVRVCNGARPLYQEPNIVIVEFDDGHYVKLEKWELIKN